MKGKRAEWREVGRYDQEDCVPLLPRPCTHEHEHEKGRLPRHGSVTGINTLVNGILILIYISSLLLIDA